MDYAYLITPFCAWLLAGTLKFLVNSMRAGQLAFGLIGYGGLPSNHSAIVSSMVFLVAIREGIESAAFGVALTVAFVVMMDAASLRKQVGKQAAVINDLSRRLGSNASPLRERIGHTKIEIFAGIGVGALVGVLIATLLPQ